jgi:RNA polymerase sigma factor (sigma-70 family)
VLLNALLSPDASAQQAPPQSGVRLLKSRRGVYTERVAPIDHLRPLAEEARSGNAIAVRKLLDAIAPAMLGVVRAVLGRADRDVEDVLQEALVGVVQGLASFRGESTIMHFARSIALRRSLDQRRKRARRAPEVTLNPEDPSSCEDLDPSGVSSGAVLVSTTRSPAASVLAERRREAFRKLLGDLRPEQAEAFAQRVLFGYSKEEIARETNVSIETVKSRLRLAKGTLRSRIKDDPALLELAELNDDLP